MKKENPNQPHLSIVTTLYKSAPYIFEFYERITKVAKEITENYNVIMVNDGSPDSSLELALNLQKQDSKIIIIDLSRNFGHHCAIMTGLEYSTGDYVFFLDSDLEEEPELLKLFWAEICNSHDIDLIAGIQKRRKGGIFEKVSGGVFNKMINFLSVVQIPENVTLIRLMTRRYVNSLLKHKEKELTFIGIAALTGYNQKYIEIKKKHKGSTTYTLSRKINLAFNYITSLSSIPLVYICYIGFFVTLFSFLAFLWLFYKKVFFQTPVGWASLIASIWLICGILTFFLGIIGIYLSKIFIEVKNRPLSIVKKVYLINNKTHTKVKY